MAALKGFQTSRGLATTGKLDARTLSALKPYRSLRPVKQLKQMVRDRIDPERDLGHIDRPQRAPAAETS